MIRVYDYRLYPTKAQEASLSDLLESLRLFYNAALQERREAYRRTGKSPDYYDQAVDIKAIKAICPEYDAVHTHLYRDALKRLQGAFDVFFRRLKAKQKAGPPRFKPYGQYTSFTFSDAKNGNGARLTDKDVKRATGPAFPTVVGGGKRLQLSGIGRVKIKLHRPYQGQVKQVRVCLKSDGHWYAQLVCADVPKRPLEPTGKSVGIDVGLSTFAALSDGTMIPNPRFREKAQSEIAKASRRVARRKKGSSGRKEAVRLLAAAHARVRARRTQFHHETAKKLVETYDAICVEDLNIKGLARGMLSKQVADVGWGAFMLVLAGKAEKAGREFVKVPAAGTSQECSGCGAVVKKGLHVRTHSCPDCGTIIDRDVNAARNVHRRGTAVGEGSQDPRDPKSLTAS